MLILVYNNVGSAGKVESFVEVALGFNVVDLIVISRAYGAAAQAGIPAASKRVFREGGKLLIVSDLKEAIELLKPDKVYVLEPKDRGGSEEMNYDELSKEILEKKVMIVIGGESPGNPLREQEMASKVVWVGSEKNIGPHASLGILLYEISKRA